MLAILIFSSIYSQSLFMGVPMGHTYLFVLFLLFCVVGSSQPVVARSLDHCDAGYVWREASGSDLVCVPPAVRDLVAQENRNQALTRESTPRTPGGPYYCLSGYVWREAFVGDTVCVTPTRRSQTFKENSLAESRQIGGSGTHTMVLPVSLRRHAWAEKTFSSTCGRLMSLPGPMADMIGWGQAEIGWLGENCMSFVLELAVRFDLSLLAQMPSMTINRAILSWNESEAPSCPLVMDGKSYRCWQNGDGDYEAKPGGCAVVSIPAINWAESAPPGLLETVSGPPAAIRIEGSVWDVTQPVSWTFNPPLGAYRRDTGFVITSPLYLRNLTAQDNTVCVSRADDIVLTITYTIPPKGGPIVPPR